MTIQPKNLEWLDTLLSLSETPSRGTTPQCSDDDVDGSDYARVGYEDNDYLIVMRADKEDSKPWYTLHRWISGRKGFFFDRKANWDTDSERWSDDLEKLKNIIAVNRRWEKLEE